MKCVQPARRAGAAGVTLAAVVVAIAMTMSGGAASAKPTKTAPLSGTITMLVVSGMPFQNTISAFEAAHPGVTINLSYGPPATLGEEFETLLESGNVPTLFYTNPGTDQPGLGLGTLRPAHKITNLAGSPWVSKLPPQAKALYVSGKGKHEFVSAYPFDLDGVGLVWNATEFKQLGLKPPKTWPQLLSLCSKIKADGKEPLLISGQSPAMPVMNIAVNTVYRTDPNWTQQRAAGKVTFAHTPAWATVFRDMETLNKDCLAPGWSGLSVPSAESEVAAGDALMAEFPTTAVNNIETDDGGAQTFDEEPFPGTTVNTTRAQVYWSDSLALSASASPTQKKIAKAFLDFLSTPKQSNAYAKAGFVMAPQSPSAQKVPAFMSAFGPFFKQNKIIQRPYDTWSDPGVYLDLQLVPTEVMLGKITIAQALASLDHSWGKQAAQP